jgi:MFS family permease
MNIFVSVGVLGMAMAFEGPAATALLPAVVPEGHLKEGTTVGSAIYQMGAISGPAIGGLAFAVSPSLPFILMFVLWVVAAVFNQGIKNDSSAAQPDTPSSDSLFAGVSFIKNNPAILGTLSLDLFAVLLGGATTLLPVYAKDILQTGPLGLGILRSAPALGALLMTVYLSHFPLNKAVGLRMFQSVIAFGLATVVFAYSNLMWLSLLALFVMGAVDMVSVIIRSSLVQLSTPDDMRGRVNAVNFLFINTSNQLGGFESGMTAALFGTVPAVAIGGVGTVLVALIWMKLFPSLKAVDKLE